MAPAYSANLTQTEWILSECIALWPSGFLRFSLCEGFGAVEAQHRGNRRITEGTGRRCGDFGLYTSARGPYPEVIMWNVKDRFPAKLIEALPNFGFVVSSTGGVTRVEKYGCGAEFRRTSDDHYTMTILPTVLLNGQFVRLWDAGYQKFLLTDDGRKFPAHAEQLVNMRKFNEELRTALGVPTYYNEALGSTSLVSVYDRVKGRVGDVPDKTVGVKPSTGH